MGVHIISMTRQGKEASNGTAYPASGSGTGQYAEIFPKAILPGAARRRPRRVGVAGGESQVSGPHLHSCSDTVDLRDPSPRPRSLVSQCGGEIDRLSRVARTTCG